MTDKIRGAFEVQYSTGDEFSDSISLARNGNGAYEQSLARVCYKWFTRGYQARAKHDRERLLEAVALLMDALIQETAKSNDALVEQAIEILNQTINNKGE